MARTIRCQIFDTFFLWLIFIKKYVFDMKKIIRLTEFGPNLSSNSEYMSDYQDKEYMNGLDGMRKDMEDYYSGKSKYSNGKWSR